MKRNIKDLHQLIELYFEGATTLEQERRLRGMLLSADCPDTPDVAEARAVMGYTAVMSKPRLQRPMQWMQKAAIVAALLTVGALGWVVADRSLARTNVCIAYVDGQRIDNHDAVLGIMEAQLAQMGEAQAELEDEVDIQTQAISEILNEM